MEAVGDRKGESGHVGPSQRFVGAAGAFVFLLGVTVLAGWMWDIPALKSVLPGLFAMKANAAVCMVLAGVSLWMLAAGHPRTPHIGQLPAVLMGLAGAATLSQYLFGWDLGIDQLLFREASGALFTPHPGRMSSLAAINYVLLAVALLLLSSHRAGSAVQGLALFAGLTALLVVGGYLFGARSFPSFGFITPMGMLAALGFLLLAAGLLAATADRGILVRVRGQLPVIAFGGAILVLAVAGGASFLNTQRMIAASGWIEHTHLVLVRLESGLSNLQEVGASVRGFVATGKEEFLAPDAHAREELADDLAAVRRLMADNPAQQERLAALQPLVARRLALADESARIRREQGSAAAVAFLASGEGERLVADIRTRVSAMKRVEEEVLARRQADAADSNSTAFLALGFAGSVSLALLVALFATVQRLNRGLEARVHERTAELQREQEFTNALLQSAADGVVACDEEGRLVLLNRSAREWHGMDPLALPPEEWARHYDLYEADGQTPLLTEAIPLVRAFRGENIRDVGMAIVAKGRPPRFVLASGGPFFDAQGRKLGAVVAMRDITERKRAEEEVARHARRLDTASRAARVALWEWDLPTGVLEWSGIVDELLGYAPGAFPRTIQAWEDVIHPDDRARVMHAADRHLQADVPYEEEYRVQRKDGTYVWWHDTGQCRRNQAGKAVQMSGACTDVTARRQTEAALAMQSRIANIALRVRDEEMFNEVLKVVLEIMRSPFGVFGYLDEEGALVVPTMTRQVWDKCQVPGKPIRFPRETWGDTSWPRAMREKKPDFTNEVSTRTPAGHVRIERHISMPILFQGEVIGLFQVANKETDYTEADVRMLETIAGHVAYLLSARLLRDRAQEALRKLNVELEERVTERTAALAAANKELEAFSYSVSHDLRAPLRIIDGFSDALIQDCADKLDDTGRRHLQQVRSAAQRMTELINDLLRLSGVTRADIRRGAVDLSAFASRIAEDLRRSQPERQVEFVIQDDLVAQGDSGLLHTALENLLGNAWKYTGKHPTARIEFGLIPDFAAQFSKGLLATTVMPRASAGIPESVVRNLKSV